MLLRYIFCILRKPQRLEQERLRNLEQDRERRLLLDQEQLRWKRDQLCPAGRYLF